MTGKRTTIVVTAAQVAAAKLRIALDRHLGRDTPPEVHAIAHAKRPPR